MAPELGIPYSVPYHRNDGAFPIHGGGKNLAFEIEVEIPASDLVFPLYGLSSTVTLYDYKVDWGDGNSDTYFEDRNASHTYSAAGTYKVSVTGDWPGARFTVGQNKLNRVTKLLNWGRTGITDLGNWFEGSTALVEVNCQDTLQWHPTASTGSMYRMPL